MNKRSRVCYLTTLCSHHRLTVNECENFCDDLDIYRTANPVHAADISSAVSALQTHFSSGNPQRPLNSLILGGPGSGKSFLAGQFKKRFGAKFVSFNISQFHHTWQIPETFVEVAKTISANPESNVIAFFDEFDVRIESIAAIQYMIAPMYDKRFEYKGVKYDIRKAALLFSGSYLNSQEVLSSVIGGGSRFDLPRLLFDTLHRFHNHGHNPEVERSIQSLASNTSLLAKPGDRTTHAGVLAYVRSLEKIVDFLSRINGFVLELRKLDSPLRTTRQPFRMELSEGAGVVDSDAAKVQPDERIAAQIVELIDGQRKFETLQRFYGYKNPQDPILEYKNLLLVDRLARVIQQIGENHSVRKISRALVNYLVVVPLVHGMRSLESLVANLQERGGVLMMPANVGVFERNISDFSNFRDANVIWTQIRRWNPNFFRKLKSNIDGESVVQIG